MKTVLSWSGGKDSALALYYAKKDPNIEIISILTTITEHYERISMHGVKKELLEEQSKQLGVPLELIYIPTDSSNEIYNSIMEGKMLELKKNGINSVIFGDIFLEDIRAYRENNLSKIGMNAHFPLWKQSTEKLTHEFIDLGFKAIITCIDSEFLDKSFIGREFNKDFIADLPEEVDLCGENGEFHTFVYDGPLFENSVTFNLGKVEFRDNRFYFKDLMI